MKTMEYRIWTGIKTRCYNPKSRPYPHYGGRGIIMCDRWCNSFECFLADMGLRPSPAYSIERIDNDGPYSPDNCRWATDLEQANNMRSNHLVTYQGITQSLADWARRLGVPYGRLRARILRGKSIEQAFAVQRFDNNPHTHRITYQGQTKTIAEWSVQVGINAESIYDRLMRGWSPERILTTPVDTFHVGRLITFRGETKNIGAWAAQLHMSTGGICKRLRSGWSIERALTTPVDVKKRHNQYS